MSCSGCAAGFPLKRKGGNCRARDLDSPVTPFQLKLRIHFAIATLFVAVWSSYGQGVFVYDQQSADENLTAEVAFNLATNQLLGQSFTPFLSSIQFVRLQFSDFNWGNGIGATVYVNLRSSSISGPILAATDPVFLPDGFAGEGNRFTNFFFLAPVPLTPGTPYFLNPVLQSGDSGFTVDGNFFPYSGGSLFVQGAANPRDLWFREGIVVPEPSSLFLLMTGSAFALLASFRRRE